MIVNEIGQWLDWCWSSVQVLWITLWVMVPGWPNITESVTFPTSFCFALEKHQEEFNVISPLPIDIKLNHNETDDALMEPRRWD